MASSALPPPFSLCLPLSLRPCVCLVFAPLSVSLRLASLVPSGLSTALPCAFFPFVFVNFFEPRLRQTLHTARTVTRYLMMKIRSYLLGPPAPSSRSSSPHDLSRCGDRGGAGRSAARPAPASQYPSPFSSLPLPLDHLIFTRVCGIAVRAYLVFSGLPRPPVSCGCVCRVL